MTEARLDEPVDGAEEEVERAYVPLPRYPGRSPALYSSVDVDARESGREGGGEGDDEMSKSTKDNEVEASFGGLIVPDPRIRSPNRSSLPLPWYLGANPIDDEICIVGMKGEAVGRSLDARTTGECRRDMSRRAWTADLRGRVAMSRETSRMSSSSCASIRVIFGGFDTSRDIKGGDGEAVEILRQERKASGMIASEERVRSGVDTRVLDQCQLMRGTIVKWDKTLHCRTRSRVKKTRDM